MKSQTSKSQGMVQDPTNPTNLEQHEENKRRDKKGPVKAQQKRKFVAKVSCLAFAASLLLLFCCGASAQSSPVMTYHNGPIMPTAYINAIFWGPGWLPYFDNEVAGVQGYDKIFGIDSFYNGFSNSSYAMASDEYLGNNGVLGPTTFYSGHLIDISPVTGTDYNSIQAEVCKLITQPDPSGDGYYPVYVDTLYPNTLPPPAWHSYGNCSGVRVQFAFFYDFDNGPLDNFGHSAGLEMLVNSSAHELSEARTDPDGQTGWYHVQSNPVAGTPDGENGDKCASTLFPVMFSDGAQWFLQGEWSNKAYIVGTGYANNRGERGCVAGNGPWQNGQPLNPSGWSPYTQLESKPINGSGPKVVSWGLDRLDLFVRGAADNALWTKSWWNGGTWSGYTQLGPQQILGEPSVVSWGPNRIDVFVQGTDYALWTKSWNGSDWSGYTQLGPNPIAGPPSVVSWGPDRIDVFVVGTDSTLYWKFWDGSSWSGYRQLGTELIASQPSVVSRGPNLIDVFVRRPDNTLWTKSFNGSGSGWSGYTQLGTNPFLGQPTAVSRGPNLIDVFVQGTDFALYWQSWDGSSWSPYYKPVGPERVDSQPSVVSWGPNRIDLFVGRSGSLWTNSWNGSGWSGYTQLEPGIIRSQPSVVSWGPNRIDVFVQGTDDAVWWKYEPHW